MTQEEKAKAYDEALERAKMYHQNAKEAGDYSAGARYENIFPELAESEDERIIRCLEEIVDWGCSKNIATECDVELKDVKDWLEKLKEQKPARWSEEDNRIRKNLMALFYDLRLSKRISYEVFDKYYPWLRSLNPQSRWKPSEEQMEALKYVLGDGGVFDREALKSLYEDLKKP